MRYHLVMDDAYYGPTPDAVAMVNRLLDLPASGHEQDWEIELADPKRIGEMLRLLGDTELNLEARSALTLLILHSLDEAAASGAKADIEAAALRDILDRAPEVRRRMRRYWDRFSQEQATTLALS